jgi:hypothetical protein
VIEPGEAKPEQAQADRRIVHVPEVFELARVPLGRSLVDAEHEARLNRQLVHAARGVELHGRAPSNDPRRVGGPRHALAGADQRRPESLSGSGHEPAEQLPREPLAPNRARHEPGFTLAARALAGRGAAGEEVGAVEGLAAHLESVATNRVFRESLTGKAEFASSLPQMDETKPPTLAQRLHALAEAAAGHQDSYGAHPTGKERDHAIGQGWACEAYKLAARMAELDAIEQAAARRE